MTIPLRFKDSPSLKVKRSLKAQPLQHNLQTSPESDRTLDVFSNSHLPGGGMSRIKYKKEQVFKEESKEFVEEAYPEESK